MEHPDPKPGVDLSPEGLAAIKARADAASSGPWEHKQRGTGIRGGGAYDFIRRPGGGIIAERHVSGTAADAEFIAAARTDVPALVAEVEKLRAELAGFRRVGWIEPDYITGQRPTGRVFANREDWRPDATVREVFVRDSLTTAEREERAFRAFKREEYEFYARQDLIDDDQARGNDDGGEG
jgi:hypothetical protein